jgi:hypothetical protein
MGYALLADVVVAFHVAYVGFIVLGQLAIPAGLLAGWGWVRNLWFRAAHLVAIAIVGLEAVWHIPCPLTTLEYTLRGWAGQTVAEGTFIGRCLHNLLFYDCSPATLNGLHIGFALLVLGTFLLAPPRWRKNSRGRSAGPLPR